MAHFPLDLTVPRLTFFYRDLAFGKEDIADMTGWERAAIDRVTLEHGLKKYGGIYCFLSKRLAQLIGSRLHCGKLDESLIARSGEVGPAFALRQALRHRDGIDWAGLDALVEDLPKLAQRVWESRLRE